MLVRVMVVTRSWFSGCASAAHTDKTRSMTASWNFMAKHFLCGRDNNAGLFRAEAADPGVSTAESLPDAGGFLSGGTIEISVNRTGQTAAGNRSGISITGHGRSAGQVWQRT